MTNKRAILRKSLPDMISDDIRERILNGELSEGDAIRQEALAEEYGLKFLETSAKTGSNINEMFFEVAD